jgi:Zn-dependent peptidase ImmA (M78 family)/DNA-binding XRE family transcriptional regulator
MLNQIRAYRDQLGFSQDDLGGQIGVTRQTIASWENGEREPSLAQLTSIARIMGVAVELLQGLSLSQERDPNSFFASLLFRADEPSALTPTIREHLAQKTADYANLEKLLKEVPISPSSFPLEGYEPEVIEDYAKEVRSWLGLGESAPVGNPMALLEDKGLKVLPYSLPDKISGFSAYEDDWGCLVVVNQIHVTERQFFTALHELAHLIFHRKEYRQPTPTRTKSTDPREKAANHLAGAILLPKSVLHKELRAYRNRWIPDPLLIDIKRRYGVSLRTILQRAEQAGLISRTQSGQQMGVLNKKCGGKDKDLPDSKLPPPQPLTRIKRMTFTALLEEEITISRAAEILGRPTADVAQEFQDWQSHDQEEYD